MLPPMSVAISIMLPLCANKAAPPPVEPPGENLGLYGLVVVPKRSEVVSKVRRPMGTLVLTWQSAPASRSRQVIAAEDVAGLLALPENPSVVSCPLTSTTSFKLTGTPERGLLGAYVWSASSNIKSERQFVALWAVIHRLPYASKTF